MFKYMVVDDEKLERKALQIIINKRQIPLQFVGEAGHGMEAVEKATSLTPDLIFMDIKMPGMNGMEAAEKILAVLPQCKIVFLTAYDQFDYAQKGIQIGAVDYLLKPVHPETLEEVCGKLLKNLEHDKQIKTEQAILEKKLDQSRPLVESALVYNLISGSFYYNDEIGIDNLEFDGGVVMVVSINQEDRTEMCQMKQVISNMMKEYPLAYVVPMSTEKIAILLGQKEGKPTLTLPYLNNIAIEIKSQVAEKADMQVKIGIGRKYSDLWKINQSYSEACNAVGLADLLEGENSILHINECIQYYNNISDYPLEAEKNLLESLRRGDKDGITESTQNIYLNLTKAFNNNLLLAKARCLQLLGTLGRVALDNGVKTEEFLKLNSIFVQKLLNIYEVKGLKTWLEICTEDILRLIERNKEFSTHRVIKTVQKYVDQNINKNITLEDICKIVFLNPQYFSRLFKKETGMTFTEYVTKRRIERAKVLLREEGLPVTVVAKKVGFSDANYFSRVFGRTEGLPPSEYAKNNT